MTIFISYPRINPRIPYQPSTLASALGPSALGLIRESRADTGFSGRYEVRYENCHMIISIYLFQDGCITLEEYLVWTVHNVLCDDFLDLISQVDTIPVGTWRQNDVRSTSMRRHDVASTLI